MGCEFVRMGKSFSTSNSNAARPLSELESLYATVARVEAFRGVDTLMLLLVAAGLPVILQYTRVGLLLPIVSTAIVATRLALKGISCRFIFGSECRGCATVAKHAAFPSRVGPLARTVHGY